MQWQSICKKGYSNRQPFVQETMIVPLNQKDPCNREDLSIEPSACLMIYQILWIHWISLPFREKCIVNTAHWQISFQSENRRPLCDLRWADSDSIWELLSGIKGGIGRGEEKQEIPIVWYSYKHYWIYQNLDKIQIHLLTCTILNTNTQRSARSVGLDITRSVHTAFDWNFS